MGFAKAGLSVLLTIFLVACAKNDTTVARLEGAEPQRLSFGTPGSVQEAFTRQMQACWFDGSSALLVGYQYDTRPAILETGEGLTELPQVTIQSGPEPQAQRFLIQFYPFNNNTLISTRNLSFPANIAARLKKDVESWVFGKDGCEKFLGIADQPDSSPGAPSTGSGAWAAQQEPGTSLLNR